MCVFLGRVSRDDAIRVAYLDRKVPVPKDLSDRKLTLLYAVFGTANTFKKIPHDYKDNKSLYHDGTTAKDIVKIACLDILQTIARVIEAVTFFVRYILGGIHPGMDLLPQRSVREQVQRQLQRVVATVSIAN